LRSANRRRAALCSAWHYPRRSAGVGARAATCRGAGRSGGLRFVCRQSRWLPRRAVVVASGRGRSRSRSRAPARARARGCGRAAAG
jgi:hypothetical protein